MIPIGVITKDRVDYLDVTLKSLSATSLPKDQRVILFDDGSDSAASRMYYDTNSALPVTSGLWPKDDKWSKLGLGVVSQAGNPVGIKGKVKRVSLRRPIAGEKSLGVVNGSTDAISNLFQLYPAAPGVLLLQDDIVFKEDWMIRIQEAATTASKVLKKPLGVLAGLKLNHRFKADGGTFVESGITAQCLYVTADAYQAAKKSFFARRHTANKKFDDMLRRHLASKGFWVGCINPFVCQHIGVRSTVRSNRKWYSRRSGRVGYYVSPPYAMTSTVKNFASR